MSSIDDALKEINQELEDMAAAESAAQEKGLSLGDYDLQSATKARAKDRIQEELQAKSVSPTQPIVTINGEVVERSTESSQPEPQGSMYTNVDPLAYQTTMQQQEVYDFPEVGTDEFTQKYAETVAGMKKGGVPSLKESYNLYKSGGDAKRRIVEELDATDPKIQAEINKDPTMRAWLAKYGKAPEKVMVVEHINDKYNGKPVRYIQPVLDKDFMKKSILKYDPKDYPNVLNPRLEYERTVRDMFKGELTVPEIEKEFDVELPRVR